MEIRLESVTKTFGGLRVLADLRHTFSPGRVTALVGPNGAGKTTLLKCILGLVRPDSGRITVAGHRIDDAGAYRRDIGFMPQLPHFPTPMTGWELARMLDELRGYTGDPDETLIDAFDVRADMRKPFRTLSGGTRQKVNGALAFRYRAPVLILDEPTAGLDPVSSLALKDAVRARREAGATVLVTSHDLGQLEALADEVLFLLEGTIAYAGPLDRLLADASAENLEEAIAALMRAFDGTPGGRSSHRGDSPPTMELVS